MSDEIHSNNYRRNTLPGESILRLEVTVDEPKTVRLIGKFGVRSKNLDPLTSNRTQNLKTDYCRGCREFKFYLTWICSGCLVLNTVWNHPKLQEFFAQIEYSCVFDYLNKCNSSFKWPEFHNLSRYTIFKLVAWQYIVYALMQMWRCFFQAKMSCFTYKRSTISTQYWLFLWNVRFRFLIGNWPFDVAVVSKSVTIEILITIVYFGRVSRVNSNLVHEISRSFFSHSTLLGKKIFQPWSSLV